MSMARLVPASKLALKSLNGSFSEAPWAKVSLTLSLYVSPVQMIPSCDQTGTPAGLDGFTHFTSSTTSGSAWWMRARTWARVLPRQSPSSLIFLSMRFEGDSSCDLGTFLLGDTILLTVRVNAWIKPRREAMSTWMIVRYHLRQTCLWLDQAHSRSSREPFEPQHSVKGRLLGSPCV